MVVHLNATGHAHEDEEEPQGVIPLRGHWVRFDTPRWTGDPDYARKAAGLYDPGLLPVFDPATAARLVDLDELDDGGVLLVDPHADHLLEDGEDEVRRLAVTSTRQTGDIPHVAAAMVHEPRLDVLLVHRPGDPAAKGIADTYRNAVRHLPYYADLPPYLHLDDPADRVRTMEADDITASFGALQPDGDAALGRARLYPPDARQYAYAYTRADGAGVEYKVMRVGGATTLAARAAKAYGHEFFAANAVHLRSDAVADADADAFLRTRFGLDLSARRRYLVVWSRYSGGMPGGYNPAGDSSRVGNTQLVELGRRLGRTVVTIGHDPGDGGPTPHGDVHLGEFWTVRTADNPFLGRGRPAQTNLYLRMDAAADVIQVGQKTGGMDNAALVGLRTVYLEDSGSPQRERMRKWARTFPDYRWGELTLPPTPVGKALRALYPGAAQPLSPSPEQLAAARDAVAGHPGAYPDGYGPADLDAVADVIRSLE
ncbi:hypothetical protein [Nocardiopsis trehalosi]|jgi:hypothetical protein|uniref:hypothetical protein n=1 Tax=Nocardiopsis trehalosi TaxID=109329 RepID=UPI000834D7F6|nr:hypothetical protein [Nocardiopsis trehalosi]